MFSYIYYVMATQHITDAQWQAWADELHGLHAKHPEYSDDYDSYWQDWDPTTGYTLINIPGLEWSARKFLGTYQD